MANINEVLSRAKADFEEIKAKLRTYGLNLANMPTSYIPALIDEAVVASQSVDTCMVSFPSSTPYDEDIYYINQSGTTSILKRVGGSAQQIIVQKGTILVSTSPCFDGSAYIMPALSSATPLSGPIGNYAIIVNHNIVFGYDDSAPN